MSDQAASEQAAAGQTPAPGVVDPALTEYQAQATIALTDRERWPLLTPDGSSRLAAVRDHPRAPLWQHTCGDRVEAGDLPALADHERALTERSSLPRGESATTPEWAEALVDRAFAVVPHYRALARAQDRAGESPVGHPPGPARRRLDDLAPVSRDDLMASIASFVPVDIPLDRVMEGTSSGSTGAALVVPLHPVSTAAEVLTLTWLAEQAGVRWTAQEGRMGVLNVLDQRTAFTYASSLTTKGEATMARLNLHADAWRAVGDREAFLADADPQVLSGTPLSLLALADLAVALRPLVVFSGAATLTPAARTRLVDRWGAPVIDVYGTREAGLIAADLGGAGPEPRGGHVVLPRRVHVEIVDAAGAVVPDGERGDVVVTVDDNPYLPLLRYRTGDTASLTRARQDDGSWGTTLHGLDGRPAIRLRTASGAWVPSVDATQVLQAHGLAGWHLRQSADGGVHLVAWPAPTAGSGWTPEGISASLASLLGVSPQVTVVARRVDLGPGPRRRFTSDLDS